MDIGRSRKDLSSVEFDTRTKAVMARSGGHENIREKINAVRLVVNNKSNNEIVLVLQQFDFSVDKTVQAFVDGRANEVLNEWNTTGKKKPNAKKKKGRGKGASEAAREEVEPEPVPQEERDGENGDEMVVMASEVAVVADELVAVAGEVAVVAGSTAAIADGAAVMVVDGGVGAHNGDGTEGLAENMDEILMLDKEGCADSRPRSLDITHAVESAHDEPHETSEDVSQPKPSTGRTPPKQTGQSTVQHGGRHRGPRAAQRNANTAPNPQPAMFPEEPFSHPTSNSKKPGPNIEKSVKDLQRCTASLTRYRLLLKEEMDTSVKKIKSSFYELQQCLMDREVSLLSDIDKVKEEAIRLLKARQEKAGDLKRRTDNSVRMSEAQLASLRADIKQFVSERKYDEELSKTLRFVCDCESMKLALQTFGEVGPPKNSVASKPRSDSVSSQSSVTPVTTPSDVSAPVMPLLSLPLGSRPHASRPATGNDGSVTTQGAAQSTDRKPGSAPPFQEPNGSQYGGRGGRTSQSSRGFRRNARNVPPRQDGLPGSGYQRNPPRDRPRSQGQMKPESQTSTATEGKPQNGPGEPQRALDGNQHTKRTEEIRPKVTEGHRGKHSEERHKRADGSAEEQLQVRPSEVALPPRKPRHRPEAGSSTRAPLRDGCGGGSLQQNGVAAPEVTDRRAGYSDEWGC